MMKLKLYITIFLIACIYEVYIESAVLKSEIDVSVSTTLNNSFHLLSLDDKEKLSDRLKRSMKKNESETLCGAAPCGYCPYIPHTGRTMYFIRNTCKCPDTRKCVLQRDKYSGAYYIYHCSNHIPEDNKWCPGMSP